VLKYKTTKPNYLSSTSRRWRTSKRLVMTTLLSWHHKKKRTRMSVSSRS